jgi:SAM-dependent methyltransferase
LLHGTEPPSDWVKRWSHLVQAQGTVLDVACGHGRHAWWFYRLNHALTLIDRSQAAMDSIAISAQACNKVVADIENGPWPLTGRQFDAVVVTNYLWRPLMPTLLASLAPGGVLIYETFTAGNETVGKPSRADFLLHPASCCRFARTFGWWRLKTALCRALATQRRVLSSASWPFVKMLSTPLPPATD